VDRGISFLVLPEPTAVGVEDTVRALGLATEELVRTEVLRGRRGSCLLLVPADRHLDLALAQKAIGDPDARPATQSELREMAPGCDLGALPPLSRAYHAPLYVDPAVADRDQLVFAAGRSNVLVVVEREALFRDDPYAVAPLTRLPSPPREPTDEPSRRAILDDESLRPVHLETGGDEDGDRVNDDAGGGAPRDAAVS
jgi:Ala-tRNA(Pro) deacylase